MAKKRVQHEIKIIVILAVLSVIFFGLAFGIKAIQSHQSDETQAYIDKATMLKTFQKIQVENSEEPFVLAKKEGTWYCEADDELAISNLRITMMRTVLKYFKPSRVITDCSANWADFGLDKPQSIITLASADKENTYLVGNYNPVLDQYYMALKGDDVVFMVEAKDMEDLNQTLLGLAHEPDVVSLKSENLAAIKVSSSDDNYTIEAENGKYMVKTGLETFEANQYSATSLLTTFTSNSYRCVAHQIEEKDLGEYALDKPEIKVTFTDKEGKDHIMSIGTTEDGKHYVRQNDSRIIYSFEERSYTGLLSRKQLQALKG